MREMGIEAIYPKKKYDLSDPNNLHKKYPYLLRNFTISRPNQVWGTDITYLKLNHGFAYLTAIMDWFSRYVVSWEVSSSLEIDFVVQNLQSALKTDIPEIHNSDQGSHFTSSQYINTLEQNNIQISMDGRGRCMDNIFTERLWRSVKYEDIYIKSYNNSQEARIGLEDYFYKYNNRRPHQSLNNQTPAEIYFNKII
jgi:putative transposase